MGFPIDLPEENAAAKAEAKETTAEAVTPVKEVPVVEEKQPEKEATPEATA